MQALLIGCMMQNWFDGVTHFAEQFAALLRNKVVIIIITLKHFISCYIGEIKKPLSIRSFLVTASGFGQLLIIINIM